MQTKRFIPVTRPRSPWLPERVRRCRGQLDELLGREARGDDASDRNDKGQTEPHEVPVRHEFMDGDALLSACIAGCGLTQLPTWLAGDAVRSGALVQVLSDITCGSMPIHPVWQKTWHLQPKVRVTVDELIRVAADTPEVFNTGELKL